MKVFECTVCGWIYNAEEDNTDSGVARGTLFEDLPETFECPVCGEKKVSFVEKNMQ